PAVSGLTKSDISITDLQDEPIPDGVGTLETADQGATDRASISLRGGTTYKISWSNPSGYEIESAEVVVPTLDVSALIESVTAEGFTMHVSPAVSGLAVGDITLSDQQGALVSLHSVIALH